MTNRSVFEGENQPSHYFQYERQRDIHNLSNTDMFNMASHQIVTFLFHDMSCLFFFLRRLQPSVGPELMTLDQDLSGDQESDAQLTGPPRHPPPAWEILKFPLPPSQEGQYTVVIRSIYSSPNDRLQNLPLLLNSCVTLGTLSDFSVPKFPYL